MESGEFLKEKTLSKGWLWTLVPLIVLIHALAARWQPSPEWSATCFLFAVAWVLVLVGYRLDDTYKRLVSSLVFRVWVAAASLALSVVYLHGRHFWTAAIAAVTGSAFAALASGTTRVLLSAMELLREISVRIERDGGSMAELLAGARKAQDELAKHLRASRKEGTN